jgi:hypothetical protein
MGLVGVFATQLWHHTYIDPSLADLPTLVGANKQVPSPSTNGGPHAVLSHAEGVVH